MLGERAPRPLLICPPYLRRGQSLQADLTGLSGWMHLAFPSASVTTSSTSSCSRCRHLLSSVYSTKFACRRREISSRCKWAHLHGRAGVLIVQAQDARRVLRAARGRRPTANGDAGTGADAGGRANGRAAGGAGDRKHL